VSLIPFFFLTDLIVLFSIPFCFFFCFCNQNMSHALQHATIGHEAKTTQTNWDAGHAKWNKHDDWWEH